MPEMRCKICGVELTPSHDSCEWCVEAINAYQTLESAFSQIEGGLRVVTMMREMSLAVFDKGGVQSIGHKKTEGGQISPGIILAPLDRSNLLVPGGYIRHALEFYNNMLRHEKKLGLSRVDIMHVVILKHIYSGWGYFHYATDSGPAFRRVKSPYSNEQIMITAMIAAKYGIEVSDVAAHALWSTREPRTTLQRVSEAEDTLSHIYGLSNGGLS